MELTEHNIADLTPQVIGLLDDWMLRPEQVMRLLGIEDLAKPRDLVRYRNQSKHLAFSNDIVERVEHINGISEALRTTHPFSAEMRVVWLRRPHKRFNKTAPLAIMLADGLEGMVRVRVELDCAYGWSLTDS